MSVITARKRSCGKVMFSQVCIILSTEWVETVPLPGTIPLPQDHIFPTGANPPPPTTKAAGKHPTGVLSCYHILNVLF